MSTDLVIAVLSLASLQIGLVAWLRADMRRMEERIDNRLSNMEEKTEKRLSDMEERIDSRLSNIEGRVSALEHSQAKLEGLLEGLREAIVSRAAA